MSGFARPLAIVSLVALLVATACSSGGNAPGTGASGSTINVMSLWGGSEQDSFQKVLDAFKTKTGVTAKYESIDRKSTRLNSSHSQISYAVFCLKKKKLIATHDRPDHVY